MRKEKLRMSLADIIQIIIGILSLMATIAVSFSIYWLQMRHEKEMKKVEEKRRIKEKEEKAKRFLIDNSEERDYLPWCALASNLHRFKKHTRKIYKSYCLCEPELQNEILKQAGFNVAMPGNLKWKEQCIDMLRKDIEKFQLGKDILYEGEKYFLRGYDRYKEFPWDGTPCVFQPICKEDRLSKIYKKETINIGDYIGEYYYYFIEQNMKFEDIVPEPPIDYVWRSQNLDIAQESDVCMWTMELVQQISYLFYEESESTENILDYTDAVSETYEDKYYEALQALYNTYYKVLAQNEERP